MSKDARLKRKKVEALQKEIDAIKKQIEAIDRMVVRIREERGEVAHTLIGKIEKLKKDLEWKEGEIFPLIKHPNQTS